MRAAFLATTGLYLSLCQAAANPSYAPVWRDPGIEQAATRLEARVEAVRLRYSHEFGDAGRLFGVLPAQVFPWGNLWSNFPNFPNFPNAFPNFPNNFQNFPNFPNFPNRFPR